MDYGVVMFATDYAIAPDDLARGVEERGFESLWFPEHTHIPASRRTPWPGGADLPKEYWHTLRPVRCADGRGRRRDQAPEARHRHLPRGRARPDHHREGSREPRSSVGRPLPVRHRRRLERRRDGEPRHTLQDALARAARARAGDEGDLDEGRSRVPRRVRELRQDLVLSQARAEAASADRCRRRRTDDLRSRRRILRRLDADQPAEQEPNRTHPGAAPPIRESGTPIRSPCRCPCISRRPSGQRWTRLRRPVSSAPSSACHPCRATPRCRASTPTRR